MQGEEKYVCRPIQLFSSSQIFSKIQKIYSAWRETRGRLHEFGRYILFATLVNMRVCYE